MNEIKAPTYRMYIDENGNYNLREDLENERNRYLCLTGVIMTLSEHKILEQQLYNLKQQFFGSGEIVLHRREIVSGRHPFEALQDVTVRDSFNSELLRIITEIEYTTISVVIDKKAHVEKYTLFRAHDPYALAIEVLMQRYYFWMKENTKQNEQVYGDIMAESRGGREDMTTKEAYKLVYEGKGYYKLDYAPMFFSSKEIKLKKKKENIAGLQFADLLSHPARRYILSQNNPEYDYKETSFAQEVVDILVESKFRQKDGKIEGAGAIFFPK